MEEAFSPETPVLIRKIVSGGQTGADRAALDVAIRHNFPHQGWCPGGRKAEDGPLPPSYNLVETPSGSYLQRTRWNARDSDGTVIFTLAPDLTGGSRKTLQFAEQYGKPCLHLSRERDPSPVISLWKFIHEHRIEELNVAGSRGSKEPDLYAWVTDVLENAFFGNDRLLAEAAAIQWIGPEMQVTSIVDHEKEPMLSYGTDRHHNCWRVYFSPRVGPLMVGGQATYLLVRKGDHEIITRGVEIQE